jgi:hypothetical protein
MQTRLKSFFTAAIFLTSLGLSAQEVDYSHHRDFLARLSYESSPVVQREGVRHICVSVARDGEYRIVRLPQEGEPQRLQGKMSSEQIKQLKTLLRSDDFRDLSGSHGGLIFQEAESFGAEIGWREDETQRLQWLNADGKNPFPASVAKVVDWLRHFEPTDGKSFGYAEYPDVCPSGGLRLLQPTVAANPRP